MEIKFLSHKSSEFYLEIAKFFPRLLNLKSKNNYQVILQESCFKSNLTVDTIFVNFDHVKILEE